MMKLSVITPVYNEVRAVEKILDEIKRRLIRGGLCGL